MEDLNCIKTALLIIPKYDGNPNQLNRFILTCESILSQYYNTVDTESFSNTLLLHSILNRLEGKAEEIVNINGVSSWEHMKQVLLKNFGDQRDENCLTRDLVNMKQENESPQEFYNRCMNILNTIINYISLHESDQEIIKCKRMFFHSQTLKTFLAGLKEPLGATIRAMRPTDMPTALNFIKEEENIRYSQKSNFVKPLFSLNKPYNSGNSNSLPFGNINKPLQHFKPMNVQKFNPFQSFHRPNNHIGHVKGNFHRPNINNNGWNRPQHPPPQPGSRNQFVGKLPSFQPKPEPMSGISHQSANRPNIQQYTNYHNIMHPSAAACNQFEVVETNPNIAHADSTCDAFLTDNDVDYGTFYDSNNCNEYYSPEYYNYDVNTQLNSENAQLLEEMPPQEQNFCKVSNVKHKT